MGEVSFLSDEEDKDTNNGDNNLIKSNSTNASLYDPSHGIKLKFELDVCLNLLIETLLSLQPDQLAQLFLVYDCQPLSENIIRRSLHLLLKYSQSQGKMTDLTKCFSAIGLVMRSLLRYDVSSALAASNTNAASMD